MMRCWAVENGITRVQSETTFGQASLRTQIVASGIRQSPPQQPAQTIQRCSLEAYKDSSAWAVKAGVTGGQSAVTFEPGICTRADRHPHLALHRQFPGIDSKKAQGAAA